MSHNPSEDKTRLDGERPSDGANSLLGIPDHQLLRRIGGGSYGEVWLARNIMGSYRAVKIVYRTTFSSDRPYEREFTGIQKFEPISRSHEGLVDVLQVGRNDPAGYFYYVMELADDAVTGVEINPDTYVPKTLGKELCNRGRLPAAECLALSLSLTAALGHLHQHGLIHRDIKPSNIIFVNGIPKLADIGLVAGVQEAKSFVGTEGFIPPEGPGTTQADLYSLGKVMYEVCTGKDRQEFPDLPTRIGEGPDGKELLELNEVVLKACEHDPGKRYRNAEELQADLVLLQSGKSVKRLRSVERRLTFVTRIGTAIGFVAIVAGAAYLFQTQESRRFKQMADENRRIADESRERLVRLDVANGARLVDQGDSFSSLLWFTEALRLAGGTPSGEATHRLRIASALRQTAKPVQFWLLNGPVHDAEFSPDGGRVATAIGFSRAERPSNEISQLRQVAALLKPRASNDVGTAATVPLFAGEARVWDATTGEPVSPPLKHGGEVWQAAFSPDGRFLVTASEDRTARVWDTATGQALGSPMVHNSPVHQATFSLDGARVVTVSSDRWIRGPFFARDEARVWDAKTGKPITPPLKHYSFVNHAAFSPDGRRVVTDGKGAQIWDATTGKRLNVLEPGGQINQATFSPDGRFIVTCGADGKAQLWEAESGTAVSPPMRHDGSVNSAAFSPDGRRLVTASDMPNSSLLTGRTGQLRVWDVATGEPITASFPIEGTAVHTSFNADGRHLITTSAYTRFASAEGESGSFEAGEVRALDPFTGEWLVPPLRYLDRITHAEFSTDGHRFLIGCEDGSVEIWDLTLREPALVVLKQPARQTAEGIPPRGEAKPMRGFLDQMKTQFLERASNIVRTAFSQDGRRLVTASANGTAQVWDVATGQQVGKPMIHATTPVSLASFSPDGRRVLTAGGDFEDEARGEARVWDAVTGQPVTPIIVIGDAVAEATFSPDGGRVVLVSGGFDRSSQARIYDAATGEALTLPLTNAVPVPPPAGVAPPVIEVFGRIAYSPDGRRLIAGGSPLLVWDAVTGDPIRSASGHDSHSYRVGASADGRRIVLARDDFTAQVLDARSGQPLAPPFRSESYIVHAVFGPDGRWITTTGFDGATTLWDAQTGKRLTPFLNSTRTILSTALSSDGQRVATVNADQTVQVWDVASGELVTPPLGHGAGVAQLVFSPDGAILATVGGDRVILWPLSNESRPMPDLVDIAQMLSRQHLEANGHIEFLSAETTHSIWKKLKAKYPQDFAPTPRQTSAWHRRQTELCERDQQWRGALFHLDRLIATQPNDQALQDRRHRAQVQAALDRLKN